MAYTRAKGQEVEIILVANGSPQRNITAIKSLECEFDLEILQEGYLGETTDRSDYVFKGMTGKLEAHIEGKDLLDLLKSIIDNARRRVAGTRINIKASLNLPDGTRPMIVMRDVSFGSTPVNFGGRAEYVAWNTNFRCDSPSIVTS